LPEEGDPEQEGEEVEKVVKWKRRRGVMWGLVEWAARREDGTPFPSEWVQERNLGSQWVALGKAVLRARARVGSAGKRKGVRKGTGGAREAKEQAAAVMLRRSAEAATARAERQRARAAKNTQVQRAVGKSRHGSAHRGSGDVERRLVRSGEKRKFGAGAPSGADRTEQQRTECDSNSVRRSKRLRLLCASDP
jgi:hypothetical protein